MEQRKNGGCCLGCLISLVIAVFLMLTALYYGGSILDLIDRFEEDYILSEDEIQQIEQETDPVEEIPEDASAVTDEEFPTLPPAAAEPLETEPHILNILLIGQDRREGEGRQRSDSMILCTINTRNKTLVMTSFLRDLYVNIPDWNGRSFQDNRLNVCYALGGMGLLDKALEQNFGVQVDHNIEVDFSGFEEIVSLFGGIEVYLTEAEANYLGQGLAAGVNRLDPGLALEFARIRKLDSDFGRTDRQRRLLKGMLVSVKDLNYDQLVKLVQKALPMITTDMGNDDIASYMLQILPLLPELTITTQYIPASGTYKNVNIRNMAVLLPDMEANIAILKETLR